MKIRKQISFLSFITLFVVSPLCSQERPMGLQENAKMTVNNNKRNDDNTAEKNTVKKEQNLSEKRSIALQQWSLTGCWENSFKSIVKIESHDLTTGEFKGKYSSTTGSSGVYFVHGYTNSSYNGENFPVTMTISWRTIVKNPTLDNSQYWTSIMTGTYSSGNNSLKLMNVISSAIEFKEVAITESGNYPESLEFIKKDASDCAKIQPDSHYYNGGAANSTYEPLMHTLSDNNAIWKTSPSILPGAVVSLKFDPIPKQKALKEFAKITGKATLNGANGIEEYSFIGEASYFTPKGKATLSITFKGPNSTTIGLSGVLDKNNETLEIAEVHTQGIEKSEYMANRMRASMYKRTTSN